MVDAIDISEPSEIDAHLPAAVLADSDAHVDATRPVLGHTALARLMLAAGFERTILPPGMAKGIEAAVECPTLRRAFSVAVLASLVLTVSIGCAAPSSRIPASSTDRRARSSEAPKHKRWEFDDSTVDRAADPCEDFYRYACGSWLDSTAVPDGQDYIARTTASIEGASGFRVGGGSKRCSAPSS